MEDCIMNRTHLLTGLVLAVCIATFAVTATAELEKNRHYRPIRGIVYI